MNDTVRLGRVAGVRVGLNWSLVVMAVLIAVGLADNRLPYDAPGYGGEAYAIAGVITAVVLLIGVLLHEIGHAVMARRFRLQVDGITLSAMGGVTRIEGDAPTPVAELLIAGVGPVVSAAFGGLLWLARLALMHTGASRLTVSSLGWLATINVVLAVFNLLPASPLDGGRVLHALVWAVTRDRWRSTQVASAAGMLLGGLMVLAGFLVLARTSSLLEGWFVAFVGWWLLGSARAERQVGQLRRSLDGVPVAQIMRPVGAAPGWITIRTFAEQFATGHPGWVWLLENWDSGYGGVLLGDAIAGVPFPQWDIARPLDVAAPISTATGAAPTDDALQVMSRLGSHQVVLVVDGDRTVGAVLPADLDALARMGRRGPVPSTGWTLIRR
jgi:Zn-dependent protease